MKKLALAAAVAAVAGSVSTGANAAGEWVLSDWFTQSGTNGASLYLYGDGVWDGSGGVLTFSDDGFGGLTADAGTVGGAAFAGPTPVSTTEMTGWNISSTGASTGTFECVEGTFGATVGASICGNYTFGGLAKSVDESSYNTTTGITTIGGDDVAGGANIAGNDYWGQSINDLQFPGVIFNPALGVFGTDYLSFTTRTCTKDGCTGDGSTLTFLSTAPEVPVPAAAWLFGSALIGLAGIGRKRKMS
jgi:hypothetical protein